MLYITGDTHRELSRLFSENFPEGDSLTKEDLVLICGDFGGVWDNSKPERKRLDKLDCRPFTTLFLDGNHENFDRLKAYPVEEWHGGKVQKIRPHVIHLMRGQVYELDGRTVFTMGGAASHDIEGGILNPHSIDYEELYVTLKQSGIRFRVNHRTWWKEELPSLHEYEEARKNLDRCGWKVDLIFTHCAPESLVPLLTENPAPPDELTLFLEELRQKADYRHWYCGHYHLDKAVNEKFTVLSEQIIKI